MHKRWFLLVLFGLVGCRSIATSALADALSGEGTLGRDDDPELVRDAAPFGLKTMETVLAEQPHHLGLLASLASGFTQYAYAFVQQQADADDFAGRSSEAKVVRARARKLFLRARTYGLRALEEKYPGLTISLLSMKNPKEACANVVDVGDVPLLYWTAAAWALAISNGKEDMTLVAQLPGPEALANRALFLDEGWKEGTLHEFFVTFEASKPGGTEAAAKKHLDRAQELSKGKRLGVLVSWAEGPLVQAQKRDEFVQTLNQVIAADAEASEPDRLANTIAQRRARMLLAHLDDLFNQ